MNKIHPSLLSLFIHLGFVLVVGLFSMNWSRSSHEKKEKVSFEVYEAPKVVSPALKLEPHRPDPNKKTPPPEKVRQVFGVSRKSLTTNSDSSTGAEVKQGNTIAKANDQLQLKQEDLDQLPIPADEFLISSMPKMDTEFRIPYPPEAKAKGVEGPVVMDLLIDEKGFVRQVVVIKGPGFGLNEAAENAAKQFKFQPARVGEKTVAVKIKYTYKFVLENR